MKVLFVYSLQKSVRIEKPVMGQEGIQFGISYISSVLKQAGHKTDLIVMDRKYGNRNIKRLQNHIASDNPDLICFTAVYSEFYFISDTAKKIKNLFPRIPLMIGGVHVTLNPTDELLDLFDVVCIGEGEQPVSEYLQCIEKNESVTGIKNLWLKRDGKVIKNETRDYLEHLDSLPFPDRDLWQKWILETQTRITVLLGRGCPYNCTYCSNHALSRISGGEYVRLRSPENILSEIKELHSRFPGIDEYFLEVETIGCDMEWLSELCRLLHENNLTLTRKLKYSTNLRVFPGLDSEKIFSILAYADFESVIIGLESGNERIRRDVLHRVYSNEEILKAVEIARKYKIKIGIFNMVGLPGETLNDFSETVKMNRLIQPDWHSTSIFFPYQGTRLFEVAKEMNLLPPVLNTTDERQRAILDLPGFSRKEIQRRFDSFHYDVYKANKHRKASKLFLYFLMKYAGHNRFADLKISLIRVLYSLRLYDFEKQSKLSGAFQKMSGF